MAVVIVTVFASTALNAAFEQAERAQPSYGERVDVGSGVLNIVRHGATGPTIVMLSGYGTAAPGLDFAPLIRELGDYQVVVVEGFGYGYSDTVAPPRTIENITAELHAALSKVGVEQPYVLMGHSLAGLYSLYYANEYRGEVSAVVGIDASVPGQINGLAAGRSVLERLAWSTGLLRAVTTLAPALAEPDGDAFTLEEREQMRLMVNWNYTNPALVDEANQATRNFATVDRMTYPSDLPVLSFVTKEDSQPRWGELHKRQLQNLDRGELVKLDGAHYLHWTHAAEIAEAVTTFLTAATADAHTAPKRSVPHRG
jgi:pimeloyl-ACP methyl ester carboxylesterase